MEQCNKLTSKSEFSCEIVEGKILILWNNDEI